MEYKMEELNGIYKGTAANRSNYYIILFENGKSKNYIQYNPGSSPVYGQVSGFYESWGTYVDAEPHEIASLEQSIIAKSLVIVEKKKEELSHIPLMF